MLLVYLLLTILAVAGIWASASIRVVKQYERGLVFRFGRVHPMIREPSS